MARALEKLGVHGHGDGSDESDGGDNDGDDFDDDEVAFGMVTKKGAKPKKKNTGPSEQRPAAAPTQRHGTIDEEDGEEDEEEDGDDADDETRSTAAATTISTLSSGLPAADAGAARGDRKGKTARRIEKERQAEREQRASQLKARIELEQARLLKTDASTAAAASAETAPQPASAPAPAAAAAPSAATATATATAAAAGAGQKCNTCGGCFADATAYRAHFRSEWHRCVCLCPRSLPLSPHMTTPHRCLVRSQAQPAAQAQRPGADPVRGGVCRHLPRGARPRRRPGTDVTHVPPPRSSAHPSACSLVSEDRYST